jgi:hypothetical protein
MVLSWSQNIEFYYYQQPITMATRSKAWTVFNRSNTGIVDSNPTRGIDVCARLFCVCAVLYVGSSLATGWSPVQGVLPTVYRIKKLKKAGKAQQRAVEPLMNEWIIDNIWIDIDSVVN